MTEGENPLKKLIPDKLTISSSAKNPIEVKAQWTKKREKRSIEKHKRKGNALLGKSNRKIIVKPRKNLADLIEERQEIRTNKLLNKLMKL